MSMFSTSIKIDYPIEIYILNLRPRETSNNEFFYMLTETCGEVVKDVKYTPTYLLRPFSVKLEKDTLSKLDKIRHEIGISRSEVIRRMIYARAKKLC